MQSVSAGFNAVAAAAIRKPAWRLFLAFDKTLDPDITFFTIGESLIGGPDFIPGTGDVVQEWDKYPYTDYSDRVISMEWQREETIPSSLTLAFGDIVLDNSDGLFTPGGDSDIAEFILPYRPVRILSGFGSELVPQFIGLTEKMPEVNEKTKTVRFHVIDYLSALMKRPLDEAVIYQDMRVDEILAELFELVGLLPTQYEFDEAFVTIPFAYFDADTKLGDAVKKLVQADLGSMFLSETGVLRYRGRQNFDDTPVLNFDRSNTFEFKTRTQSDIINVVTVKADVRSVQPNQLIYTLSEPLRVGAGQTAEMIADFQDPVVSVDAPVYVANTMADGSGTDATGDISVDSQTNFAKASKLVFENGGVTDAYITQMTLYGEPAQVTSKITVREEAASSVGAYDEQVLPIDNEYIQDESTARSLALLLLSQFAEFGAAYEAEVHGNPALQLDDQVGFDITSPEPDYAIIKIQNRLQGSRFRQFLRVKSRTGLSFFTIQSSLIQGGDVIAP